MSRKCIEFEKCPFDDGCKCSDCSELFECDLCFRFGCMNHVVEEEKNE